MPTTLNQYVLGRTLGCGVSCKVKLAKDAAGTRYAIKILNKDEQFQELIQTEVDALTRLTHANIIRLIEMGEGQQVNPKKGTKHVKYMVLELVGGGELFDFVSLGGRLSEAEARYYFKEILAGLDYMHQKGIAHRDLKPENLILNKDFVLKISDFGFAAPNAGRDGKGLLDTQLGTSSYMAPEIHMGKPYKGNQVDLFATAIILFVTLTQRPPFESANPQNPHYRLIAANRADLFWQAHAEAEAGTDIYSPEFKDLFEKMMAFNPANRLTIEQIMEHPWMQGSVPSYEQIKTAFVTRKEAVDAESHKDREAKRNERNIAKQEKNVRRSGAAAVEDEELDLREAWEQLEVAEYGPFFQNDFTQFFTTSSPLDYFEELEQFLTKSGIGHSISGSYVRVKFPAKVGISAEDQSGQDVNVKVEVLKVDDLKNCIKFTYRDPVTKCDIKNADTTLHFIRMRDEAKLRNFCDSTFEGDSQ